MSEKLISANALKTKFCARCDDILGDEPCLESNCFFMALLEESPAVDAVEVDKVAQMFYEFTDDACPCYFIDVGKWLPEVCELQSECPHPADWLGCWKQFVKHYGERREEE